MNTENSNIIKYLIEHGANIEAKKYDGQTALHQSSARGILLMIIVPNIDSNKKTNTKSN